MSRTTDSDRFSTISGQTFAYRGPSVWEKSTPYGVQALYQYPIRSNDYSIIAVLVPTEPEDFDELYEAKKQLQTKANFVQRIRAKVLRSPDSLPSRTCFFMPRREYLRHFARDQDGHYVGTEPERRWSRGELEDAFGHFASRQPRKWTLREEEGSSWLEEQAGS